MRVIPVLSPAVLLLVSLVFPNGAQAAQSMDACTGFIDSAPATITTQGVWCLRRDLTTGITSGAAITVAVNNVTIDCNDLKIGGLAAGIASQTYGISSSGRQNTTVRNCNVRGFYYGVSLTGGAGHLVEHNRMDNNLRAGVYVTGENNTVRSNRIYDTGGASGHDHAFGILASADVIDNTVAGVFALGADSHPHGISMTGAGTAARDNRVSRLMATGAGAAVGVAVSADGVHVADNHLVRQASGTGVGVQGFGVDDTFCSHNTSWGFATATVNCSGPGHLAH